MLAGRRAFDGEHVSDVLAAVLTSEPAYDALPTDVPRRLQAGDRPLPGKEPQTPLAISPMFAGSSRICEHAQPWTRARRRKRGGVSSASCGEVLPAPWCLRLPSQSGLRNAPVTPMLPRTWPWLWSFLRPPARPFMRARGLSRSRFRQTADGWPTPRRQPRGRAACGCATCRQGLPSRSPGPTGRPRRSGRQTANGWRSRHRCPVPGGDSWRNASVDSSRARVPGGQLARQRCRAR